MGKIIVASVLLVITGIVFFVVKLNRWIVEEEDQQKRTREAQMPFPIDKDFEQWDAEQILEAKAFGIDAITAEEG